MHSAVDTAYKMLQEAKTKEIDLSNLQLQKLIYIAHGYLLGWKGKPLISDEIQAWKYGPVISDIYHKFKNNGKSKISSEGVDNLSFDPAFSEDEEKCIRGVLDLFGKDSAESLISITHQDDTPWDKVWNSGGKHGLFVAIPDEIIKNHYRDVVRDPKSVSGL